jgi:hypothetical protein
MHPLLYKSERRGQVRAPDTNLMFTQMHVVSLVSGQHVGTYTFGCFDKSSEVTRLGRKRP